MADLVQRLTNQLRAKGVKGAKNMAIGLLKKRGDMKANGTLTTHGKKRQAMGAAGRAIDRASKASGNSKSIYKYNKKTNRATIR